MTAPVAPPTVSNQELTEWTQDKLLNGETTLENGQTVKNREVVEAYLELTEDPDGDGPLKPKLEEPGGGLALHALLLVLGEIGINLRKEAHETWGQQLKTLKKENLAAADSAYKKGITQGWSQIAGGVVSGGFSVGGMKSLMPKSTSFTANPSTKVGDQHLSGLKNSFSGKDSHLSILSDKKDPFAGNLNLTNKSRGVEHFEPKYHADGSKPVIHKLDVEVRDLQFNNTSYKAAPIKKGEGTDGTTEVNHFRFESSNGKFLGLDHKGEIKELSASDYTKAVRDFEANPKENPPPPKLLTMDGNQKLYIGGEPVGSLAGSKANIFEDIPSVGGVPVKNGNELTAVTPEKDPTTVTVEFVEMKAMTNSVVSGHREIGSTMADRVPFGGKNSKILYARPPGGTPPEGAKNIDFVAGVPKKVGVGTPEGGAVSDVLAIEKHQTSQNYTAIGTGVNGLATGTGGVVAAGHEQDQIEHDGEKQVQSLRLGETQEFRSGWSELLREVIATITATADADKRIYDSF